MHLDAKAYYDATIFFPLSWEYDDVERWIAEECPPLWHYTHSVEPNGQFSVQVKYQ